MRDRPEIDLDRSEYSQVFDRPLASPKHLRRSLAIFLSLALGVAAVAIWLNLWWMTLGVIPVSMWAGAALAGLWPNMFFGTDPSKDDNLT
jgi:hypothetical protein